MLFRYICRLLLAALIFVPAVASAADLVSAKAFVADIYARLSSDRSFERFHPLNEDAPRVFDSSLVGLIRENDRLTRAAGGEIGALDYDPLCGCQDIVKMKVKSVRLVGPASAEAEVGIVGRKTIRLSLVVEGGLWRIHDIEDAEFNVKSLRALLSQANRDAVSHH